jgi:hypothetical protein
MPKSDKNKNVKNILDTNSGIIFADKYLESLKKYLSLK